MDDKVSRSRFVPAPPQAIFDLLADPRKHALIDGSGTLVDAASGPERLSKGATFGMSMKLGVSYTMKNTVEEFEEDRTSVVEGKSVSVRVDLGGRRIIQK